MTLDTGGGLTGIPTAAGTFSFIVTATDTTGASSSQSYTLIIKPNTVYVDPTFTGSGQPSTDPGLGLVVGVNAFSTITAALSNVASGGTVVVFGGTYTESVNFNLPLAAAYPDASC